MNSNDAAIASHNEKFLPAHRRALAVAREQLAERGVDADRVIAAIADFSVAIPSWALGTGGTRFGRYSGGGEPRSFEEKLADTHLLNSLTRACASISIHIPWDIPADAAAIRRQAADLGLRFDAVNSNTFQDYTPNRHSYKFGSLCHTDKAVRDQAVAHNLDVVNYGAQLGSDTLTVWLADGTNFPGQANMRAAWERTLDSLQRIYKGMPQDFKMLVEYKPFEPYFYSTVIPDWGTSYLLTSKLGDRANVLVDLGHHLPNTNIEQIVATLIGERKLGGFHFNDSKYADDDLTTGSIRPYQLFLIFLELVGGMARDGRPLSELAWMIDESHNLKDPLEDLLQSVEALLIALAQALVVDREKLSAAQDGNDPVLAQELLHDAFRSDLRPLVAEARLRKGGALRPIAWFRENGVRERLIRERGSKTQATGL